MNFTIHLYTCNVVLNVNIRAFNLYSESLKGHNSVGLNPPAETKQADRGGLEGGEGSCPRQTVTPWVSVTQLWPGPVICRVGCGGYRKGAERQVAPGAIHTETDQKTLLLRRGRHSPDPGSQCPSASLTQTAPPGGSHGASGSTGATTQPQRLCSWPFH